jgi:hypothetical protein
MAGAAGDVTTPAAIAASGTYYIRSENATGCYVIQPVTVTINTPVNAGVAAIVPNICINGSGLSTINLLSKLSGYSAASGTWTQASGPATGASFDAAGATFNPNGMAVGTYVFRYTLTATAPCPADTEDVTIVIEQCCPVKICVPVTLVRN